MENIQFNQFLTAHNIAEHPLKKAKKQTRQQYYRVLIYFISRCVSDNEYIHMRLAQYRKMLADNAEIVSLTDTSCNYEICSVINNPLKPWIWKQRLWLMCDIALISANFDAVKRAQEMMKSFLNNRQCVRLDMLVSAFFTDAAIPKELLFAENWINQFRMNRRFKEQPEIKVFITANMSAGKSTLINAMIGKPITRTSQEACTANLCYLFDKPFEDHAIHLQASTLNLDASRSELMDDAKADGSFIASWFRKLVPTQKRICLIDSPGVNSAMHQNHGERTRKAIADEKYDKLVYVLNANKLGTDEELRYLKYIAENVPHEKVIFVLNKLDDFKHTEDSIKVSVVRIYNDLLQIGYENPIICPLSAYCAWLVKMKQNSEALTEDEEDICQFYLKKFSKAEYDLSAYYTDNAVVSPDDEWTVLAVKCGMYGFENILYGGMVE